MPSPFPGMDPYLEGRSRWPDLHSRIINIASDQLIAKLRPKYLARIEERVYISDEMDSDRSVFVPDIKIVPQGSLEGVPFVPRGGVGVDIAEPIVVTNLIDDEIHEARIEMIDRESRSVVTVIEILSPSNKLPGSAGTLSFEAKRREIMDSPMHWVEIDLLRTGRRIRFRRRLPDCDCLAYVSHAEQRPQGLIWPIRLSQRLPVISIPLKPEDADATLDLQDVLNTAYDRAGYDLDLDYTREPVPPLPPEWAEWSDKLLKSKSLRPA